METFSPPKKKLTNLAIFITEWIIFFLSLTQRCPWYRCDKLRILIFIFSTTNLVDVEEKTGHKGLHTVVKINWTLEIIII